MQIDMHYYGTYCLAMAAGLTQEASRVIATSSQFVDDNVAHKEINFNNGAVIDRESTAHHLVDRANYDETSQRRIWVPFHFLPGNEGEEYTERLKCRMNGRIAQEMMDYYLTLSDRRFILYLLGISAHVYSDTFAHYGFSGVSSRRNKIVNDSFKFHTDVDVDYSAKELTDDAKEYLDNKLGKFSYKYGKHGGLFDNIKSWLGENVSGALGHGAVATFPDMPYLVWSFDYEMFDDEVCGRTSVRINPLTFLEACRAMYNIFRSFVKERPYLYGRGDYVPFEDIEDEVERILHVCAGKTIRIRAWKDAAYKGIFTRQREVIPEYVGDEWNDQWQGFDKSGDYNEAINSDIFYFYQAASLHRTYVLRDLLPSYELVVN